MTSEDRIITCKECGRAFAFTAEDQTFYAEKGFSNEPKRCFACRRARRGQPGSADYSYALAQPMQRREMHPVVCARCGVETTVPFVPRGDRPVYCRECFTTPGVRPALRPVG